MDNNDDFDDSLNAPVFYVDIPDINTLGPDSEAGWVNLKKFNKKEDAVLWIRENIGDCDDDGNIRLITG